MTTNHQVISHTRLATLKSIESMLGARNRRLPNPTVLNNSGIQIHRGLVLQFSTTILNGVQGVFVTTAHSTKSMIVIMVRYLVFVRNDGILIIVIEIYFFYLIEFVPSLSKL
jgi:hypothetical protein